MNVPLSKPDIGEVEIEYVTRVLRSGQLSLGPVVREFEEKFAAYIGARYAVAVNSGTSALHLCVRALGIGPEDEVLTTSFSFVASANCLLFERALPVFIDIDPATLNIDPEGIRRFLRTRCASNGHKGGLLDKRTGRKVKAILPVHVFGLPCNMNPILDLAREYGLRLIEDACEAVGAEYRGRRVGTLGDVGVFAFYPNKQMTAAEGGMILTNDARIAELCRSMRNQGRGPDSSWLQHVRLGFNYRLSDVHCALGLAQLERIDTLLRAREAVANAYNRALSGNPLVTLPGEMPDAKRSWFVYVIQLLDSCPRQLRDRVLHRLREQGVGCQVYFPPIHRQSYMEEYGVAASPPLPRTESVSDRCLALPFFAGLTEEQISHVRDVLVRTLEEEAGALVSASQPANQHPRRQPSKLKATEPSYAD